MTVERARIEALLTVSRRIADPDDALGRRARARLPATSGLSPAGVELALTRHLETHANDAQLERLLAVTSRAPTCHLLLAANVCTAALRAIACALATSARVRVRASSRDPVVAELLIEGLGELPGFAGEVTSATELQPAPGDEVHLYGSDETLALVTRAMPPATRLRAHGTGLGLALLEADADLEQAALDLADDLVPFDGRGCLSPRVALIAGGEERGDAFACALHQALSDRGAEVPRGPLGDDEQAELSRYRATYEAVGRLWFGAHHAVAFDPRPEALHPAPPLRATLVAACEPPRVAALLEPWAAHVAALGNAGRGPLGQQVAALCPRARRSPLGAMQRPPLDGPVDLRSIDPEAR